MQAFWGKTDNKQKKTRKNITSMYTKHSAPVEISGKLSMIPNEYFIPR